jgi:type I restriction enzyme S subunit
MKTVALPEAAKIIMGQSPPSSSYNTVGDGLPFFQGKADFGDLYPTVRMFCTEPSKIAETGDVLISVRAPVGPTNISPQKSCIGRGLAAIRAKKHTDTRYLLYFLRFYEPKLAKQGKGSTFSAISRSDLESVNLPLPPLPEQQRIAAVLAKADRLRRLRRTARELSDTYLQAVFLEMFGDPVANPKGWEEHRLGKHLTFITSGGRGWAKYYSTSGDRFIRSLDVQMNHIADSDAVFVTPPDNAEAERTRVQGGDVLLTITGSRIGRVAPVPESIGKAYVSQHVAILRLDDKLCPDFLSMFLSLEQGGQRQIQRLQYGQTKPGLGFEQIRSFKIPVPSLGHQQQFAAIVHKFERLRAQQREAERQAEHLFQALLERAFRGEV